MLDKPDDAPPREHDLLLLGTQGKSSQDPKARKGKEGDDGSSEDKTDDPDAKDAGKDKLEDKRSFWRKHPIAVIAGVIVLIVAIVAAVLYYLHARHFESTDDAFIDGRPVSVSAEVAGNIVEVPVTDNQIVHAGDLLVRIDDRNYTAAVDQAQAQIDEAQAQFENFDAQVSSQKSLERQAEQQSSEAKAALEFAQNENTRYQQLATSGYGTVQRAQQAASDLLQRQAALAAAVANQASADKQINVLKAQRRSAEAQIEQAKAQKETADANLTRTQIRATVDGRVARLTGAPGFNATSGQVLMIVVPLDAWVTANFKETQLADMRVGQPVDIAIDAVGRTYPGKVESIQAGSGTAFSLLPAQNATGNYVKVVQRIPVKIVFDERPDIELGPGMSVVPTARVR